MANSDWDDRRGIGHEAETPAWWGKGEPDGSPERPYELTAYLRQFVAQREAEKAAAKAAYAERMLLWLGHWHG
jgi:hypothetical protein